MATTLTSYAACATNNVLSSINGQSIYNAHAFGSDANWLDAHTASAVACCELCQRSTGDAGCQAYAYTPTDCWLAYSLAGACPAGQEQGYFELGSQSFYTGGNGPCGYFYAQ